MNLLKFWHAEMFTFYTESMGAWLKMGELSLNLHNWEHYKSTFALENKQHVSHM